MTFRLPLRNISLVGAAISLLGLSACAAQNGSSRYGDCAQPCVPAYQANYVQSYYQAPVQLPAPTEYFAPKIISAPPKISCPAGTIEQDNGTCLQPEQSTYSAPVYTPPSVGYTPDPIIPPKVYRPIRK